MSRIGKNIKKARSEKGYTQEQLAQKLSVTRNTISNYETGHSNPDIEMLQMLAEALGTDPNTLIYGEKKSQSVDQSWREEILKRIAWLIIAGVIMMISSSLMKYGNEIAKDTLRVPFWNSWLLLTAYPLAFVIIGMQLMSLAWRACGKRVTEHRWTKVVFWILIAAFILWVLQLPRTVFDMNMRGGYMKRHQKILVRMNPCHFIFLLVFLGLDFISMYFINGCGFLAVVPMEWCWRF